MIIINSFITQSRKKTSDQVSLGDPQLCKHFTYLMLLQEQEDYHKLEAHVQTIERDDNRSMLLENWARG